MKIKREFVLREIAGDILLVPAGKTALDLNGMVTLNAVGAEIWKMLPEVKDADEIVFHIRLMLHIKAKLTVHGFKLIT